MKKTLLTLSVLILLTSCSNNKWDQSDPDMPKELRESHEEILEENLTEIEENEEAGITAYFEVAYRYHQLGDYLKAIEYYEYVLDYDVNHIVALNNMADLYEDVEEYALAAEYIKRLYEIKQTDVEVVKDSVRILLKADDPENAALALQNFESLVFDYEDPDPYYQEIITSLHADINKYAEENF